MNVVRLGKIALAAHLGTVVIVACVIAAIVAVGYSAGPDLTERFIFTREGNPVNWTRDIECPECGEFVAVKEYEPGTFYRCMRCGHETPIDYGFEEYERRQSRLVEWESRRLSRATDLADSPGNDTQ